MYWIHYLIVLLVIVSFFLFYYLPRRKAKISTNNILKPDDTTVIFFEQPWAIPVIYDRRIKIKKIDETSPRPIAVKNDIAQGAYITEGTHTIYAQLVTDRVVTKATTFPIKVKIKANKEYVLYYDSSAKAVLLKEKGV